MTPLRAAYHRAYHAYLSSGLSKAEFYRRCLSDFLPKGEKIPSLVTFYAHFNQVEAELVSAPQIEDSLEDCSAAESVEPVVVEAREIGRNIRFAEISDVQLQNAGYSLPGEITPDRHFPDRVFYPRRLTGPTAFRMRLSNGTEIEFATPAPEFVAMEMMRIASGS